MDKIMEIQNVASDIRRLLSSNPGLIKKIGIFGSLARGDHNDISDIDILVEHNMTSAFEMMFFTNYCELCNQICETLTEIYQRKVDIVHFENGSLSHLFDSNIEKEVFWL